MFTHILKRKMFRRLTDFRQRRKFLNKLEEFTKEIIINFPNKPKKFPKKTV